MDTTAPPKSGRRRRRDPVLTALRRLLVATDKSIRANEEVRQARVELARVMEEGPAR